MRLFPDRSRPPLPVYVKEFPWSCKSSRGCDSHKEDSTKAGESFNQVGLAGQSQTNESFPVFKLQSLALPQAAREARVTMLSHPEHCKDPEHPGSRRTCCK